MREREREREREGIFYLVTSLNLLIIVRLFELENY